VALIEDNAEIRALCVAVLEDAGFDCDAYDSARASLVAAQGGSLAGIVLVDLELPGESSFDAIRALRALAPASVFIALTAHAGDDWLFPALKVGCAGYVLKSEAVHRLGEVLREIAGGGTPLSPPVARRLVTSFQAHTDDPLGLSARELELARSGLLP